MSKVRVLVGTKKGAFTLTADGKRKNWQVSGPHFAGWEIYHVKGSSADPNRIYASQTSGWFGQIIQRSDDGGKTWNTPGSSPDELQACGGTAKAKATSSFTKATPALTSGTTARSIPGNSSASGISNLRSPIQTRHTQALKTPPFSKPPTAARHGRNFPACAKPKASSGNRVRVACARTPFCWILRTQNACTWPFPLQAHSARMMAAPLGNPSTVA